MFGVPRPLPMKPRPKCCPHCMGSGRDARDPVFDCPACTDLYFLAPPVQRTLYQENVVKPGWIEGMPLPATAPLYTPEGK